METLCSIIIPAFNIEEYIGATLASVVAQTYRNIEVIIIDDGSTDATAKIVKAFAANDPRIVYLNQENQGPGAARNYGLRLAKGAYIVIFDGDDLMLPMLVARVIAYFTAHPEYGLVYWRNYAFYSGDPSVRFIPNGPVYTGDVARNLLATNFLLSHPAIRRETYEALGGYDDSRAVIGIDDWDFSLKLALGGVSFGFIDEPLGCYRKRPSSLSSYAAKMYGSTLTMLNKYKSTLSNPALRAILFDNIERTKFRFFLSLLAEGNYQTACGISFSRVSYRILAAIVRFVPAGLVDKCLKAWRRGKFLLSHGVITKE